MTLYSSPPSLRDWQYDKPTLLVCWWATLFCVAIIAIRVAGRFIRTERLFREDKMAALAIIPMLARMGCVHYILRFGTNNADFTGVILGSDVIRRKEIGSGLVLASRILYATTLWILKDSIFEFLRRLTGVTWSKTYEKVLFAIRCALGATFVAVVISTFAECRPFSHYWQVLPDPGGQCRQGYAQLITLAACNILTDIILVVFPVPIILRAHMPLKRKIQLVMLFSLSLAVAAVAIYRVTNTIAQHGRQQYRSLLASVELLFATGAANSLVLGSFVRDRGLKKKKYDLGSVGTAADMEAAVPRRPTLNRHWGSDDNLVRELGLGVHPELRYKPDTPNPNEMLFRPAPPIANLDDWHFPASDRRLTLKIDDTVLPDPLVSGGTSMTPQHEISFHDVGSLLSDSSPQPASSGATLTTHRTDSALLSPGGSPVNSPGAEVWRPSSFPSPVVPASGSGILRGSTSLLQDLGGLLIRPVASSRSPSPAQTPTFQSPTRRSRSRPPSELLTIPQGRPASIPQPELRDPGGLLGRR